MSGAPPPDNPNPQSLPSRIMEFSRPVIAFTALALFGAAFVLSWRSSDQRGFELLVGAIIAMVTQVQHYYFGSSSSTERTESALRDAALAPDLPVPPIPPVLPPTPIQTGVPPP